MTIEALVKDNQEYLKMLKNNNEQLRKMMIKGNYYFKCTGVLKPENHYLVGKTFQLCDVEIGPDCILVFEPSGIAFLLDYVEIFQEKDEEDNIVYLDDYRKMAV